MDISPYKGCQIHILIFPFPILMILVPNNINIFIHLLNPITHEKQFQD